MQANHTGAMTQSKLPLSGIRVLDLTNVISGPFCCFQLALMGAEVIKVEIPGQGDLGRGMGVGPELKARNMGSLFLAQNAGKSSLTLNLKHPGGKTVLKKLVQTADVLVENFRPGVMTRLELDYEALRAEKPDLIYCAISGFGQDSPLRDNPAYDQIVQGLSGAMSTTGTPQSGPLRAGYPVSDSVGGLSAAFAIATALVQRQRDGIGTFIDVSMLDATLSVMTWATSNALIARQGPDLVGNDNFSISPSGAFQASDDQLNIAANSQQQYENLCKALQRPDLVQDPRFVEGEGRLTQRNALKTEIESALAHKSAAEWVDILNKAGVPAGLVLSLPEALAQPHVREGGRITHMDKVPGLESVCAEGIDVFTAGYRTSTGAPHLQDPPPQLGQHTQRLLEALGYTPEEIAELKEKGTV